MDSSEATKIVFSRIQTLDPENATKIMGYIFIQDNGEKEMIRLAFGPETVLLSLIHKAKTQLGILSNSSSASSTPSSPSIFNPNRPNPFPLSSPRIIVPDNGFSGFSEYRSPSGHLCPKPASSPSYAAVVNGSRDSVSGPFSPPSRSPFSLPPHFCSNSNSSGLSNELLFLDESLNNVDYVDPIMSPTGRSDSMLFPYGMESGDFGGKHNFHRRSCSVSDVLLGGGSGGTEDGGNGFGWRPCVYFSRGFCKNGNSCKFLHGGFPGSPESKLDGFDELLRMKAIQQQRFAAAAAASQLMGGGAFPYNKNMNILNDSPRSPSAALMMGEEFHNFGRCRPERSDFSVLGLEESGNSSSRQIYLTFPADSSFMEEDVSNYFSTFGPVQDVRIPYQQKRMFGFVSFVYPETVKIILAKGNPHFVCDSRVLVKPYKEKGKVLDKKQQQHHMERGLSFDSLEPYDLPVGPRMFLNSQEMMLRRRLEQVELRQAIEFQGRRMMNLQVTDLDNHHHSDQFQPNQAPGIPVPSHAQPHLHIKQSHLLRSDGVNQEVFEENNSSSRHSPTATADQQLEMKEVCNNSNDKDSANINEQCSYPEYDDIHESLEHILPDNLFASPTKSAGDHRSIFSTDSVHADDSTSVTTTSSSDNSPTLPATSTLNMASPKSCFFQILRKVE